MLFSNELAGSGEWTLWMRCAWFSNGADIYYSKELTFVLSFSFLVLSSSLIPFSIRQNEICKSVFIPRCTIHLISINFVGTRNAVLPPQPPSQHENTIQAKRTNFEIWNTNLFADVVCGVPSTRFTRNSSNSFTNSQSIEMHPNLFQLIFRFSFLLFSLLQNYNYRKRIDWEIHVLFKLCYKYCSFGICHTSIFATYKFSTIVIYSTIQRNRITNWYEQRVLCVRVDWWPILNWWTHLNYKNRKIQFFRLPKRMKILTHHHRRRDASTIHTHKRLHALRCAYPIGRACVSTLCERMKHTKCVRMCVRWERARESIGESSCDNIEIRTGQPCVLHIHMPKSLLTHCFVRYISLLHTLNARIYDVFVEPHQLAANRL